MEIKKIKIQNHTFNENRVCVDCNRIKIYDNKNYVEIKTAMQNNRWYYSIDYSIGNTGSFSPCMPLGDGYPSENKAICKAILEIYNNSDIPNKYRQVFRKKYLESSMNKLL